MKTSIEKISQRFPKANFSWVKNKFINEVTKKIPKSWNFVGGCVRDSLLGKKVQDIDINTEAKPEEIEEALKKYNLNIIGKRFGTIGIFHKKWKIEITTNRADVKTYGRSADVSFEKISFEDDVSRRDFTINALMLDKNNIIYDYYNGLKDLERSNVKFIRKPIDRIKEDYLRILRYIRFFVRYGKGESPYINIFKKNLDGLKLVSMERILSELEKICLAKKFKLGLSILNQSKISKKIFGADIFTDIPYSVSPQHRFILLFWQFHKGQHKNLPLPRKISKILFLKEILADPGRSFLLKVADLWAYTKDINLSKQVLTLDQIVFPQKEKLEIIRREWLLPNIDLSSFQGKARGIAERVMRFLYLKGKEFGEKDIEKNINNEGIF